MKKTRRRDEAKRLKRLGIVCEWCGQAPALRRNKFGMAVCGKTHSRKKLSKKGQDDGQQKQN